MKQYFVRKNASTLAIVLFLFLYISIVALQPNFLYNTDGSLREFGIGFSKKTVFPAWLLAISIAIMSYFSVFYYINMR